MGVSSSQASLLEALGHHQVVVCAGSGGVGKTTLACCLGILLAQQGKKVLVLTIDPARRLASALGLASDSAIGLAEVKVPGQNYAGELYASMIDPQLVFDDFVQRRAPSPEAAERLMKNSLYRQLVGQLSGSQEFTSLERLLSAVESNRYDVVILDTPPTQHAVDFLRAPERIFALFQESVTKWFARRDPRASPSGGVKKLLNQVVQRGTHTALKALEKITGSAFVVELGDFFESMAALQSQVSGRSIEVHRLLTSERTGFLLVTGFDHSKLVEAKDFYGELKRGGYSLSGIIVNRSQPSWLSLQSLDPSPLPSTPQMRDLLDLYQKLQRYYVLRQDVYGEFQAHLRGEVPYWLLPEIKGPVQGLEGLEQISRVMSGERQK